VAGNRLLIAAAGCLVVAMHAASAHFVPSVPRPTLTAAQTDAIDQLAKSEMTRQRIPGLEVGVYSRGQILLAKGYGLADVELNVPATPETLMQSGSVGKQFVSAAIMMLIEENKLSLDDSITGYFPDAPATWKPILIKNLLSHTSGLSEYESGDRTGPNGPFYLRLDRRAEVMPRGAKMRSWRNWS
jgi:CubicO group peptidase (beta-lactamase class C family)